MVIENLLRIERRMRQPLRRNAEGEGSVIDYGSQSSEELLKDLVPAERAVLYESVALRIQYPEPAKAKLLRNLASNCSPH